MPDALNWTVRRGVGRAETAAHALRIIFGGVFDRFPKAKLLLGHMGEALPFLLWRLDKRGAGLYPGARQSSRPKSSAVTSPSRRLERSRTNHSTAHSRRLARTPIMFSVDHPFEDMKEANCLAGENTHIRGGGREDLFGERQAYP